MNPYASLAESFQQLATRSARWKRISCLGADPHRIVATIRANGRDVHQSDLALRSVIEVGRSEPDAMTVALHALAPMLRRKLSNVATEEYCADALCELAFIMLETEVGPSELARRLVNRAHSRVWNGYQREQSRGTLNIVTTNPCPPHLLDSLTPFVRVATQDVGELVAERVDLSRFAAAVDGALDAGKLSPSAWETYRELRLRTAVMGSAAHGRNAERVMAHRTARRLDPLIKKHLTVHAA